MFRNRIALATDSERPHLIEPDRALIPAFAELAVEAVPAIWSAPRDWTAFDAVLLRNTWDYPSRAGEFLGWLAELERQKVTVWNPVPLVRWNHHKGYLRELAARGVPCLPTREVEFRGGEPLLELVRAEKWEKAVVKPAVSAGAWRTVLVDERTRADAFAGWPQGLSLLVQPFAEAVVEQGEWSLFFFDGELSHAVLKAPRSGDFRVQMEFGGTTRAVSPPRALAHEARRWLDTLDERWLYARVDLLHYADSPVLMELELIEPNLFLEHDPAAVMRLARATTKRLRAQ